MPEETINSGEGLLARFARGEPSAFAEIMREHQAMVFSLALHFLKEPTLAEDLAQEVFLQLYQNRAVMQSPDHLRFWLRKVACHRSMDCARRSGPRRTISLEDIAEPAVAETSGDPLFEERLWRLVGSLPEKARMVLILRYQEDLAYQEIAEVMEIPVNTVKSTLERGLALLREKLTRALGGVRA